MNRNVTMLAIAVFGIVAGILGYWLYEDRRRPGIDINIGGHGVSIRER